MLQLRVTSSELKNAVFELSGEYFTIGREPDNNIQLDHTSVSKHHAILKIDGGDFKLFDLHSTNGVIVNGTRQVVAHLREGDKILLGEVELRFEADAKDATQQLAMPMLAKPETKVPATLPPAPKPAPPRTAAPEPMAESKAVPTPTPPVAKPEIQPVVPAPPPKQVSLPAEKPAEASAVEKPAKKKRSLLALFRRKQKEELPPPPPSREEIHAGLTDALGKMGLEMPKPAPPRVAGPSEQKPARLPPPPKTPRPPAKPSTPESKAQLAEVLPATETRGGSFRELGVKLSWAMGRFLPERTPPLPPLPPPQEKPTQQVREQPLQVKPTTAVAEIELNPVVPSPVATITIDPPKPATDRLLRTPLATPPAPTPELPAIADYRGSRQRFVWAVLFVAGIIFLGLGYALEFGMLKFFGLVAALTGLLASIFSVRFGSIVAPPKKRPVT